MIVNVNCFFSKVLNITSRDKVEFYWIGVFPIASYYLEIFFSFHR